MEDKVRELTTCIAHFTKFLHEEVIESILESEEYVKEPQRFFYSMLFKLTNGLDTCNFLICNFTGKSHFMDSLFVVLRSLLSDTITFNYVIYKSIEKENLEENITRLYYDHVDQTLKNIKGAYRVLNNLSQEEVEKQAVALKKARPEYCDKAGEPKQAALVSSASGAIKYIFSTSPDRKSLGFLKRSFFLYDKFSKYEHFGDLSFELMHRQFDEQKWDEIYMEIVDAVYAITFTIRSTMHAWPELNEQVIDEFEDLRTKIGEYLPEN